MSDKTGGQLTVESLKALGVRRVFCVPGESFLPILDALYDSPEIEPIVCRQEGGAAYMAEAHGKLTGEPGVCLVSRGPGATNASIGVHAAFFDATPMVLLVGQVRQDTLGREAFQEMDFGRFFAPIAKTIETLHDPARIPEALFRAFSIARAPRPGPVVLVLPEDVLRMRAGGPIFPQAKQSEAWPSKEDLNTLMGLLSAAKKPLVVLGGSGWTEEGRDAIEHFAEANGLPVTTSFVRQSLFDNTHPDYVGPLGVWADPRLKNALKEADLVLALGTRLGDATTDTYQLLKPQNTARTLVHVYPDAKELGKVWPFRLGIPAGPNATAASLAGLPAVPARPWEGWCKELRKQYLEDIQPPPMPGRLNLAEAIKTLQATLEPDAILAIGAGNFMGWPIRFYQYQKPHTQLSLTVGAMGYSVPAAVAAKLCYPKRQVVAFAGDGCFLMNGQELATAKRHGLKIVFFVVNNGMYGTIRMHQERHYPGRVIATDLTNPDFARLAQAYGALGFRVGRTEEFAPALECALSTNGPALIELMLEPEAISTRETLKGGSMPYSLA